jgi:alkanesulfonate monooxygenase SsuD/methylene tetrahydromethanopterin reductase-like flavin-dependent oxidoreductase (luciferase family)
MIDVISRGRLEMGFVRGVPYELAVTPKSAVGMIDRFWEAHDLIIKAMSTHDGPFNWEGTHFHARNVNIWPRPYQNPHPPVWISGRSRANIRDIASRGHVFATFMSGRQTGGMFDYYRQVCAELGRPAPGADRFAYLAIVAVGDTHEKAMERAHIMVEYMRTSSIVAAPFNNPPGYMSTQDVVRMIRAGGKRTTEAASGKVVDVYKGSVQELIDAGVMFVGTPDEVCRQILDFDSSVGGMGHLLMMGHAGRLSHRDTVDNLTLFGKEVLPRLKEHVTPPRAVEPRTQQAAS